MDKNNLIGFVLLFFVFAGYIYFNAPTPEEQAEIARVQDSIRIAEARADSLATLPPQATSDATLTSQQTAIPDSLLQLQLAGKLGVFAPAGSGTEQTQTLENDVLKITFTNKGGRIQSVELKQYDRMILNEDKTKSKTPVLLLEDKRNRFEYLLPTGPNSAISTDDLYFTPQLQGNTLTFRANTATGGFFEQVYSLGDDYLVDYKIRSQGLGQSLDREASNIQLNWVDYMQKIELGEWFERSYSGVYFKEADDDPSYCSCRSDDNERLDSPVKWVSTAHQFFNTSIIADKAFSSADLDVKMGEEDALEMKRVQAKINIPIAEVAGTGAGMQLFIGPNDFDKLKVTADGLEQIIPYGWSIFGTINRYVIRPFFQFLLSFISSKGIAILVLTFLIKFALFPLTYKMLYSQQKMAALKPKLAKMGEKYADDPQKKQMETMKLYQEYGVSPLGGCMPMLIQMPIWYALFRFFPSSIDFRQASFLWADDLSSYDAFIHLPFELPFGMGSHLSLFAILWAISMLAYTYYNSKHMDFSAQPAMKYMQYAMPVMFFGFFNAYAAGLTCYMFFSNFLNIAQNLITKNFIIDHDKIKQELEDYKKKPKKKGGFQERLQEALKEQQRAAAEQQATRNKKKKK